MKRVLLSAYQCAPGQGSVSQIGWEWYSRLSRQVCVTLVTHVRNRAALSAAGVSSANVIYVDTEWFAGPLYRASQRLFPRSEHSVFLLSSLDYFVYDREVVRLLQSRASDWDLVHAVTPVSPSARTGLGALGLPLVRGPLNGGLRTPANFPEFMRADSSWVYGLRDLSKPLSLFLDWFRVPSTILTANGATEQALTRRERRASVSMPEVAVDPLLYSPTPWPAPPTATEPVRLLFVGRLIPAKALPLLFEAISRASVYQPVELTVIGDGPMRPEWQQEADRMLLRVRFLGACHPDRITTELSRAHAFCLPSVRESGGMVLLEAMSAARPVLAVNAGGPAGLVASGTGQLVCADGSATVIEGLTRAILDIAENPEHWRQRGIEGRRHVLANHTWDRRMEACLALYDRLLHTASSRKVA